MFFKRNAETKQDHSKCFYNGDCDVNINNRYTCASCRLAKCFASEMQLPSLSLLRADQSTLSIDQWNLLSNLIHCYDECSGISFVQLYILEQNCLPPKIQFQTVSVSELFTIITSANQLLYEKKNVDFISLCLHDRSILIHKTMKYVAGLDACFITRYARLLDYATLYKSATIIYGSSTLAIGHRTIEQLDFDSTFVKLVLALLTFSTFNYAINTPDNLKNIKAVLRIQCMYTALVWRYLLYKYDHEQAVRCFSNLIRCLFF